MSCRMALALGLLLLGAVACSAEKEPAPPAGGPPTENAVAPAADAAAERPETSYRPETTYRTETDYRALLNPTPTPTPIPLEAGPLDRTLDGVRVSGYQAAPAGQAPKEAILLLHEWWGLNDDVRREADWWARQGFRVLAVDLFGGQVARDRADAARLLREFKPEAALPVLRAAARSLAEGGGKVGVAGYGLGGNAALRLAAEDPDAVAAVVVFYGEPLRDPAQAARIEAPVLGLFSSQDAWVTPEKIDAFKQALKTPPQTYSYNAAPGFVFKAATPAEQAIAETARQQALEFMRRHLEP